MRPLAAVVLAVLLLALMPAFALLRYEHATPTAELRPGSGAPVDAAGPGSVASERTAWSGFGTPADAAPSRAVFERDPAPTARAFSADSIPLPAGPPAPTRKPD